jgi:hypothetical protein
VVANDGFRANDPLRKRRRRNEKCPGNLLRRQTADLTQCERNLSLRCQGGVAAGEDETKPVVLDLLFLWRLVDLRFKVQRELSLSTPSKRARRRMTSIALKRAVEISQGRGLSGIPV